MTRRAADFFRNSGYVKRNKAQAIKELVVELCDNVADVAVPLAAATTQAAATAAAAGR